MRARAGEQGRMRERGEQAVGKNLRGERERPKEPAPWNTNGRRRGEWNERRLKKKKGVMQKK